MSEGFTGVRKPDGAGGASIPGPRDQAEPIRQIGSVRFVEVVKAITIGDRACARGEVIRVSDRPKDPRTGQPVAINIMPPMPLLLEDRARWLIEHGFARASSGPATATLGHSADLDGSLASLASTVESATLPQPKAAGRAVGQPQRSGAI